MSHHGRATWQSPRTLSTLQLLQRRPENMASLSVISVLSTLMYCSLALCSSFRFRRGHVERAIDKYQGRMSPGTDFLTNFTIGDDGVAGGCKNVPAMEDENSETVDNSNQAKNGKPPRNLSVMRNCVSAARLAAMAEMESEVGIIGIKSPSDEKFGFLPVFRSGSCSEIGPKQYMEDEFACIDNLHEHLCASVAFPSPGAFYGVFDGHGGTDAALFTRKNILKFIVEDSHFPAGMRKAVKSAFVKVDHALADATSLDNSSGTTALTALILGSTMLIANAGDSRAVLGKRGRAIELSRDHKPNCSSERLRIEKLGGMVYDGYLNGQLSVARALGDWHLKGPKGSNGPLSCEPELQEIGLTEEDEFLIMGCDGLWDVMSSQCAVTMVRKELMLHNDPERCSRELVREAIKRNTCDNLTVVVICFSPDPPPRIEMPKYQKRRSISAEGLDLLKGVLNNLFTELIRRKKIQTMFMLRSLYSQKQMIFFLKMCFMPKKRKKKKAHLMETASWRDEVSWV